MVKRFLVGLFALFFSQNIFTMQTPGSLIAIDPAPDLQTVSLDPSPSNNNPNHLDVVINLQNAQKEEVSLQPAAKLQRDHQGKQEREEQRGCSDNANFCCAMVGCGGIVCALFVFFVVAVDKARQN